MKTLLIITGRGMGGDAVTAINIAKSLNKKGISCEFALDHDAPGLLLEKNNITWHKIKIPQAGGHAATKLKLLKAGIKSSEASLKAVNLIKKTKPDVVVGIIGGGAIIACLASKIANVPCIGILITPMDAKVCTKLNANIALPESNIFHTNLPGKKLYKQYSPIDPNVVKGSKENVLKRLPDDIDINKPIFLFSSGSSLFEGTAQSVEKIAKSNINATIFVTGYLLKEEYIQYLKYDNVHYLGYIDWLHDLYCLTDLAILTDDGVMIHEAIACKVPIIALTGVKYGRYHNMAAVFPGAVIESSLDDLETNITKALNNVDELKESANKYSDDVLESSDKIADIIISEAQK